MPPAEQLDLARHIDRTRRRTAPCKPDVQIVPLSLGWLSVSAQGPLPEFPSNSQDRAHWLAPERAITPRDVEEAIRAARSLGRRRLHFWIVPWAADPDLLGALDRAGAKPFPYVEYVTFSRPAADFEPARPCQFEIRPVRPDELAAVLRDAAPWYSDAGVAAAAELVSRDITQFFAAFDGPCAVAIAGLTMDSDWAYLGYAGTNPDFRSRGAQTGLIRARVRRAAELGATRCACETNTAVPISFRNLLRCGFKPQIRWLVHQWDDPAAPPLPG